MNVPPVAGSDMKSRSGFILTNYFETIKSICHAGIAQMVEPHVANVIVAGSSPVSRSKKSNNGDALQINGRHSQVG